MHDYSHDEIVTFLVILKSRHRTWDKTARDLGISLSTLLNWHSGRSTPAQLIAEHLHMLASNQNGQMYAYRDRLRQERETLIAQAPQGPSPLQNAPSDTRALE